MLVDNYLVFYIWDKNTKIVKIMAPVDLAETFIKYAISVVLDNNMVFND